MINTQTTTLEKIKGKFGNNLHPIPPERIPPTIGMNLAKFQLRYVAANLVHYFDFELEGEPTFEYFVTFKTDELMIKFKERQL